MLVVPESMPSHAVAVPASSSGPSRPSRLFAKLAHPRNLGFAVAGVGLLGVVSALTPALPRRVELVSDLVDPGVTHVAAGTTALVGFVLLLLGRGLARRRRSAYLAALVLLAVSVLGHLAKGLDVEEAVLTVAVMVMLVRSRHEFTVPSPPGRGARVARLAALLALADVALGLVGVALGASRFRVPVKPGRMLLEVVRLLGGAAGTAHFHGWARLVPLGFVLLAMGTAGAVLVVAFAPAPPPPVDDEPRRHVRALVDRPGGDTLDPFALRGDKCYVLSEDGRAAVAYRVVTGVGLASGDPVGDQASFPDALDRFLHLCDERGWRPAVIGARDDRLDLYATRGLRAQYLGDEAVVDAATFSLEGRAMRDVRQAVNRTRNFGITTEVHREGDLDPELRAVLLDVAERSRGGAPERGFSMALDELLAGRDADCVIVVARDADGIPFAFQRYVPCCAGRALSLDAMRRERRGPNGVNERLIADAITWAREQGYREVSLNFAFCRTLIDGESTLPPVERAQAWVVRRLNPYFQIESLSRFNAKFRPRWLRRHLVYRSVADLPMVGAAAASAEGFLPFDRRRGVPEPERVACGVAVGPVAV